MTQETCRQCGTCCKKGGPALHGEDRPLVVEGNIPLAALFTIRQGEPVMENVLGQTGPAESDIIKIKGTPTEWTCCFFDADRARCGIYTIRPLECRLLKCWDPRELLAVYDQGRLTRRDLLGGRPDLMAIVADHQGECDYETLGGLIRQMKASGDHAHMDEVLRMVRYDFEFRHAVVEKTGLDESLLPFLFGIPLIETIRRYGFHVTRNGGTFRLWPAEPAGRPE